jgi:hypothetical protein
LYFPEYHYFVSDELFQRLVAVGNVVVPVAHNGKMVVLDNDLV